MEARTVSGPKPHRFPALMSVSTASGLVRGREGAGRLEVPAPASGRRKDTCPEGSTRAACCWRRQRKPSAVGVASR